MDSLPEEKVIVNIDDNDSMIELNIEEEKVESDKRPDGKEACEAEVLSLDSDVEIRPEEEGIEIQPREEETEIQPIEENAEIQLNEEDEIKPTEENTEIKSTEENAEIKPTEENAEIKSNEEEDTEIRTEEETIDIAKEDDVLEIRDKEKTHDTEEKPNSMSTTPDVNTIPVKTIINELNAVDDEPAIVNKQAKTRRPRRSRALTMKEACAPSKPTVQKSVRRTQRGGNQASAANNLNRKSRFRKRTENLI